MILIKLLMMAFKNYLFDHVTIFVNVGLNVYTFLFTILSRRPL